MWKSNINFYQGYIIYRGLSNFFFVIRMRPTMEFFDGLCGISGFSYYAALLVYKIFSTDNN